MSLSELWRPLPWCRVGLRTVWLHSCHVNRRSYDRSLALVTSKPVFLISGQQYRERRKIPKFWFSVPTGKKWEYHVIQQTITAQWDAEKPPREFRGRKEQTLAWEENAPEKSLSGRKLFQMSFQGGAPWKERAEDGRNRRWDVLKQWTWPVSRVPLHSPVDRAVWL